MSQQLRPWLAADDIGVRLAERGGYREPSAADLVEDMLDDPESAATPIADSASLEVASTAADTLPPTAEPPASILDAAAEASADQAGSNIHAAPSTNPCKMAKTRLVHM